MSSLVAYSGFLDTYRIANLAIKIPLDQLPLATLPCIAHCYSFSSPPYFVIVESIESGQVSYYDGQKAHKVALTEFQNSWSGHLLLLSLSAQSGEPNYAKNRRQEQRTTVEKWLTWAGVAGLVMATVRGNTSMELSLNALLGALYALGAWVSVLLLQIEHGKVSALVNKICGLAVSGQSKDSGCQSVTNAAGSKLWGVSWAEIGILYFGGGLVALGAGSAGQPLAYLHLLTLFYVPFSLYYQAFVVRAWCVLCLVVQAINIAIAGLWYSHLIEASNRPEWGISMFPHWDGTLRGLGGFVLLGAFWFILKPIWQRARQLPNVQHQLEQYKEDSALFLSHLYAQPAVQMHALPNETQIGNVDAPVVVLMVSNPHCNPCKDAYEELTSWAQYFEDEMQLRIRHIHSGEASYQTHDDWAQEVGIEYTPTLFINGHQLRTPYGVKDVWRHVRALSE